MIEVFPRLFVGDQSDYDQDVKYREHWRVVHACKEPYHRQLLGYSGRAAPKYDPEYLIATRGHRLYLNLVDAPNPAYIPREIIDAALDFIHEGLQAGQSVLVHCNLGESRSPTIALLYLAQYTDRLPKDSFAVAAREFVKIYPLFRPGGGMAGFAEQNWSRYAALHE